MCKRTWERKIKNCIIKDWWSVDLEILDDETIIYNLVGCLVIKKHYIYMEIYMYTLGFHHL